MKMLPHVFLPLLLAIFFTACSDDNDTSYGSIEITIKGTYGGKPLISGKPYNYFSKGTIELTKSEFFMSTSRLLSESGAVALKEVDYIALSDKQVDSASAETGIKLSFPKIPAKKYTGLSFILGLTAAQNATKPVDYFPTEPLGEGTHYWAGWNSYIFSKTEGVYNDGTSNFNFTYHSGFDDAKRTVTLLKDFTVNENQTTRIELVLEHEDLFHSGPAGFDIPANPQIHNQSTLMIGFMDRFASAFSIK